MKRHRTSRPGFSLMEMAVVMWALAILVASGTVILFTATKAANLGGTAMEEFGRLNELARLFRADVSGASETPEKLGELVAGPEVLIMRRLDGSTVVYHMVNGTIERQESRGDEQRGKRFPFAPPSVAIEFKRPADTAKENGKGDKPKENKKGKEKLVTLRITSSRARGVVRVTEVKAVLGGERR